jgi:hypothetical protein
MLVAVSHKNQNMIGDPRLSIVGFCLGVTLVTCIGDLSVCTGHPRRDVRSDYDAWMLWSKGGKPWQTVMLRHALKQPSTTRMAFKLIVQNYRHLTIAIDREHV